MEPLHSKDTNHGNPVGLPQEVAEKMAKALDRHLSSYIVLYQQYHKHHWLVEGPQFRDLHHFFEINYNAMHEQYDMIAERLTVLGGIPTVHPTAVVDLSYVDHEPEGQYSTRDMLLNELEADKRIAEELRKTCQEAISLGDIGTSYLMQELTFKTG